MANKEVEEIIDGLLKLQDVILGDNPADEWVKQRAIENAGNVAYIHIVDEEGSTQVRLKLDENLRIVKTNEPPTHVITMHIDVFLGILAGEIDPREAYVRGLLSFRGKDYHFHALMWAKSFERLRKVLERYGVFRRLV